MSDVYKAWELKFKGLPVPLETVTVKGPGNVCWQYAFGQDCEKLVCSRDSSGHVRKVRNEEILYPSSIHGRAKELRDIDALSEYGFNNKGPADHVAVGKNGSPDVHKIFAFSHRRFSKSKYSRNIIKTAAEDLTTLMLAKCMVLPKSKKNLRQSKWISGQGFQNTMGWEFAPTFCWMRKVGSVTLMWTQRFCWQSTLY